MILHNCFKRNNEMADDQQYLIKRGDYFVIELIPLSQIFEVSIFSAFGKLHASNNSLRMLSFFIAR